MSTRRARASRCWASGTTGSGRKIVGEVIGADAVINEISAHVAGAAYTDPKVDTIFEIGGQDAKYMHIVDGHIRDANMNYVCAAGTGSFIEEQANKLGYKVADVGSGRAGGQARRAPPIAARSSWSRTWSASSRPAPRREEALAAVMVAVAKNYLNKVVGNRHRSRKTHHVPGRHRAKQGPGGRVRASARRGSRGVALLPRHGRLRRGPAGAPDHGGTGSGQCTSAASTWTSARSTLRNETCELCQNDCTITFADIEGVEGAPSWGYMCGRDPNEQKVRKSPHDRALRLRQRLWREAGAGVEGARRRAGDRPAPVASTYTYYPMWQRFFNTVGPQG